MLKPLLLALQGLQTEHSAGICFWDMDASQGAHEQVLQNWLKNDVHPKETPIHAVHWVILMEHVAQSIDKNLTNTQQRPPSLQMLM